MDMMVSSMVYKFFDKNCLVSDVNPTRVGLFGG